MSKLGQSLETIIRTSVTHSEDTMNNSILQVQNLSKTYDNTPAVKDISFDIEQGEIFSLLGPNGAGKSTTISMLSCLLKPTAGDAIIGGHSINESPQAVKRTIGVVPQEIALYERISARENLTFWGRLYGLRSSQLRTRIAAVLDMVQLTDSAKAKVETFSGGMKRRLNVAVALLHEPRFLFMDEPTVGIDPQSRRRILDTILALNAQGLTVLYTTHYMEEASELSHRIGIIDHGELIALGNQSQLTQLIGEYDLIQLQLESNNVDYAAIVQQIKRIAGVQEIFNRENDLTIHAHHGKQTLTDIIAIIVKEGGLIKRLEMREPSLEAVFLHLTGRALRDQPPKSKV